MFNRWDLLRETKMKIIDYVEHEEVFKPIAIVLETKQEAEILKSMVGKVADKGPARDFASKIYDALRKKNIAADYPSKYLTGKLRSVE